MTKTLIDIDDDLLAETAELLGTKTKRDTVMEALRRANTELKRARALDYLRKRAEAGDFDELLDKRSYRPKPEDWRPEPEKQ